MTDKPDALAELKTVREGCYHSTNFATIDVHRIEGAIAAWEKERELLEGYREEAFRLIALRAAVEKVRDETKHITWIHDALDAALRGDA